MEKTQMFGKTLYYQGDLSYFESVNMETLKNGFSRLADYGILVVKRPTNAKERTKVALHPDFMPNRGDDGHVLASGALWDLVEHIGMFRREGKNRRDNATGKLCTLFLHDLILFFTRLPKTLVDSHMYLSSYMFFSFFPCLAIRRGCCECACSG